MNSLPRHYNNQCPVVISLRVLDLHHCGFRPKSDSNASGKDSVDENKRCISIKLDLDWYYFLGQTCNGKKNFACTSVEKLVYVVPDHLCTVVSWLLTIPPSYFGMVITWIRCFRNVIPMEPLISAQTATKGNFNVCVGFIGFFVYSNVIHRHQVT